MLFIKLFVSSIKFGPNAQDEHSYMKLSRTKRDPAKMYNTRCISFAEKTQTRFTTSLAGMHGDSFSHNELFPWDKTHFMGSGFMYLS